MRKTLRSMFTCCVLVLGPRTTAAVVSDETARATDLLRAQQMADQVQRRLQLPAPRGDRGWARGGEGFAIRRRPAPPPPEERAPNVHLHVGGAARSTSKR